MKKNKIKYIALVIFSASLFFTGCKELELDTKGAVTADTYYSDAKTLEPAVIGIYARMHRATWALEPIISTYGADDLTTHNTGNKGPILEGDQFNRTGGNGWATVLYNQYYDVILQCNSFIDGASPLEGVVDEAYLKDKLANAYFMRGLIYSRLATIFKHVPMPLTATPDLNMSKSHYDDVMMQAVTDLNYAVEWLNSPRDENPNIQDGHASKTAAKAVLAKTYMQLTGYPTKYTTLNVNGTDIVLWDEVKRLNKEIIDDGVYTLMDDYAVNFQRPGQINEENIFAHICEKGVWPTQGQSRYYGFKWRDWADCFIEHKFASEFPAGYRRSFSVIDVADTVGLRNIKFAPEDLDEKPELIAEIEELKSGLNAREKRVVEHSPSINSYHHPMVAKFNYGTVPGFKGKYYIYNDAGAKIDSVEYDNKNPEYEHKWQTSNDCPVMRTAEVYLMYAEACAQTGETGEAEKYLNYIRRRAYAQGLQLQTEVAALPAQFWMNAEPAVDYTAAEGDIIEAIVMERAYEFLGEVGGNYWLDLIRLEKVEEKNAYRVGQSPDDTGEVEMKGDPSDRTQWWSRIPSSETILNPSLGVDASPTLEE